MSDTEQAQLTARAFSLLDAKAPAVPAYPIDALGVLAPPCLAIVEGGQVSAAIAGQCLLTTAGLLAQSVADVRTLAGVKPLSLYGLTIANSGDGKSTAESVALHPIRERQRADADLYRRQMEGIQQAPKGEQRRDAPREPYRIMRDATVEGVRRSFVAGAPSQGVFTSEAASILAGYGMSPDHRAKTAATFNGLWDDGEVSVGRGTTGRIQLYDRRLSLSWLIQPDAARESLHDLTLSNMGFWPRFLIAWPDGAAPRTARPFTAEADPRIRDYWRRCNELLSTPPAEDCSGIPALEATPDAQNIAERFFERMEQAAKQSGGVLENLKPFAARATEQLYRVAGVLAIMGEEAHIDSATMLNATRLVGYSLDTWLSVFGDRDDADAQASALKLFAWIVRQRDASCSESAISSIGPKALRSRSRRDTALAILEQVGLIVRGGSNAWRVVTQ